MSFKSNRRNNKILAQFLVILFLICLIKAEKVLRFGVKKMDIWSDPAYGTYTQVNDENVPKADITVKIEKDIADLDIHVEAHAQSRENKEHSVYFNVTHSFCKVLDLKNNSPLIMLVFSHLKTMGHLPEGCPIKKDTYSIGGVWPDDHSAIFNFPEFDTNAMVQFYSIEGGNRVKVSDVKIEGEFAYKEVAEITHNGLMGIFHKVAAGR